MTREIEIRDKATGKVLREAYTEQEKKFFGMFTLADIFKVGSIWFALIVFVIGMDYRLKYLESDRVIVAQSMVKLTDFVRSSDNFNSSLYGVQFEGGKPINPSYRVNNRGSVNP